VEHIVLGMIHIKTRHVQIFFEFVHKTSWLELLKIPHSGNGSLHNLLDNLISTYYSLLKYII